MAITRPDIYKHNNPNLPIVLPFDYQVGAGVENISDLYSIPPNKINLGGEVYVQSEDKYFKLIDEDNIENSQGWQERLSGSPIKPIRIILLKGEGSTPLEFAASAINLINISLEIGDIPFFELVYEDYIYVITFKNIYAIGNFGLGEDPINSSELQIISYSALNTYNIGDSSTDYIDVGTILLENNIWDIVNQNTYEVQPLSQGFTVFQATIDGVVFSWLYRGDSGTIGQGGYTTEEVDFSLLSDSQSPTPTFQQVVDASGNYTFVEFPTGLFLEDDGGQFYFELQDKVISFSLDGALSINANRLVIKNSNSSLQGQALVVQADGGVDWEDISVDLSDYLTQTDIETLVELYLQDYYDQDDIDDIIANLDLYTSTNFDEDFAGKTTDDLQEGVNKKYNVQADYNQEDNTADDFIKNKPKPAFLSTTDGEINLGNIQGAYYNLTSPVDIISFTTTNKVAGAFAIVRINADTNDDPDLVTVDGVTTGRKSSVDNWIDNKDMDLGIFVLPDLSIEWEFKPKKY